VNVRKLFVIKLSAAVHVQR